MDKKVDKKLDKLLELDIIEGVPDGPSGWISPLVVVPKSDGDVRICVDMRRPNEAIIRETPPDSNSGGAFTRPKWQYFFQLD